MTIMIMTIVTVYIIIVIVSVLVIIVIAAPIITTILNTIVIILFVTNICRIIFIVVLLCRILFHQYLFYGCASEGFCSGSASAFFKLLRIPSQEDSLLFHQSHSSHCTNQLT